MIWIGIEENVYRSKYTFVHDVYFESESEGMEWFDSNHDCRYEPEDACILCDYCKGKWKNENGIQVKFVDHDGAGVYYKVVPLTRSQKN